MPSSSRHRPVAHEGRSSIRRRAGGSTPRASSWAPISPSTMLLAARLAVSLAAVQRLRRQCEPVEDDAWSEALERWRTRLGIARRVAAVEVGSSLRPRRRGLAPPVRSSCRGAWPRWRGLGSWTRYSCTSWDTSDAGITAGTWCASSSSSSTGHIRWPGPSAGSSGPCASRRATTSVFMSWEMPPATALVDRGRLRPDPPPRSGPRPRDGAHHEARPASGLDRPEPRRIGLPDASAGRVALVGAVVVLAGLIGSIELADARSAETPKKPEATPAGEPKPAEPPKVVPAAQPRRDRCRRPRQGYRQAAGEGDRPALDRLHSGRVEDGP